jgi:hypothetical protein
MAMVAEGKRPKVVAYLIVAWQTSPPALSKALPGVPPIGPRAIAAARPVSD